MTRIGSPRRAFLRTPPFRRACARHGRVHRILCPEAAPPRPAIGVEALESRVLLTGFFVTNTADAGPGSLRQAILDSNAFGPNEGIHFAIPGPGVHTIRPLSPLPVVTGFVVI